MRKKVSIITVVYNQVDVTIDLLESLRQQEYRLIEIIVVDNASPVNTKKLKSRFPEIKLIKSQENLGFAGGNNLGIRHAKGEYLFFVNNDTVIPKGTLTGLVARFKSLENVGILCPQISYFDSPQTLQYAGCTEINAWTGRNRSIGYRKNMVLEDRVSETAFPHGAAMFTSRKLVSELGNLPEDFFLYYEELDWTYNFRNAGYKIYVDHQQHILHRESMTTGKSSPLKTYYQTRNRILFMRRNFSLKSRVVFMLFFTFFSIPKTALTFILRKRFQQLHAFWLAIKWHLKHFQLQH